MDEDLLASLVPSDAIVVSAVTVVGWIDPDGQRQWRILTGGEENLATHIGMLELAKLRLVEEA